LQRLPAERRDRILDYLHLAEELGAETVTLSGHSMSETILECARDRNVTKIVLGKPSRTGWRRWVLGSVVDVVVREAHDFDVYLLACDKDLDSPALPDTSLLVRSRAYLGISESEHRKKRWPGYLWSVGVTAAITSLSAVCVRLSRTREPRNALSARGYVHRDAFRPRSFGARVAAVGRGVRFLFRAAALFHLR
jgi:two-component system sensor histidine kinase KdpD